MKVVEGVGMEVEVGVELMEVVKGVVMEMEVGVGVTEVEVV